MLLPRPSQRRAALLVGGALTGLLIAGTGLVTDGSYFGDKLPPGAIARVDGRLITQPEFERIANALATDKRTRADGDRIFALQRIIEEELLVQRGVELGFPQTAPGIRKALAAAVIRQVVADAEALAPSSAELREFYAGDASFFAPAERWQVRWLRATETLAELPHGGPDSVDERLAEACGIEVIGRPMKFDLAIELPNQLLTLGKLMDYMGPTLATRATQVRPGECSEPVLIDAAYHWLYVEAHQPRRLPAFDGIKDVVEAEYIRRAGERALLDHLTWLRNRAEIVVDAAKLK